MLTAEVIRYIYNSQKRLISCDDCGITYSHADYNVLLDHQKILYIKYKGPRKKDAILCHECFCHNVQNACSLADGKVKLVDGSDAYILNFNDYNG